MSTLIAGKQSKEGAEPKSEARSSLLAASGRWSEAVRMADAEYPDMGASSSLLLAAGRALAQSLAACLNSLDGAAPVSTFAEGVSLQQPSPITEDTGTIQRDKSLQGSKGVDEVLNGSSTGDVVDSQCVAARHLAVDCLLRVQDVEGAAHVSLEYLGTAIR